jgi:hypothetical protein
MKTPLCTLAWLMLFAATAVAQDEPELTACMMRNIPEPDSIRAVRISAKDRAGNERETVVRVYSRRGEDGLRQVRVEFREPEEMRGSSVLLFERSGENEVYLRTSDSEPPRRVKHTDRSLPFLGTDFSYEDFEHLLAFRRPEKIERLADARVDARPVYVLESRPAAGSGSMYEKIVTQVDQKTCVPLRIDLYEHGKGLRKRLVVDPMLLRKKGQTWLPQIALMEDMIRLTSTVLMIDSTEQDQPVGEDLFALPASN